MSFVNKLVAQVLSLQMALFENYARLEAQTDTQALHDIRINLRRLRSLLRPLRKIAPVSELSQAAAALSRITTPIRDLEVLVDELHTRGCVPQAATRNAQLMQRYQNVLQENAFATLITQLDAWPAAFRAANSAGEFKHIKKLIARHLKKHIEHLRKALQDPQLDRHQLRLMVKHVRYADEAYPRLSPLSAPVRAALKRVQSTLGDWHDNAEWCQSSHAEKDLQVLIVHWRIAAHLALKNAELEIAKLAKLLDSKNTD